MSKKMQKWSVSTGSMKRKMVSAPTPMIAAAVALAASEPKSIGQIVECKKVPCRDEDEDIFYVSALKAFKLSGLSEAPTP